METQYLPPIPTKAPRNAIAKLAEEFASDMGLSSGDPIEPVISQLGGSVLYRDEIGVAPPESIRVEPDRSFQIFLPTLTSPRRDRFTIAHELGHFILHFPLVAHAHPGAGMRATRWVDENDAELQRCEWEANWFAAAFIMPEQAFRTAFQHSGISGAAATFGVSDKASAVRAKSLGLP